jgi:hypothetical protein
VLRAGALASFVLAFLSTVARADEPRRFRAETSFYTLTGDTLYAQAALVWAQNGVAADEGLRLRVAAAASTWRDRDGRSVPKAIEEFSAGARTRVAPDLRLGLHVGLQVRTEWLELPCGCVVGVTDYGALIAAEALWTPSPGFFAALDLRATAVDSRLSATLTTGWTTPLGVKLGPQLGLERSNEGTAARAGLALTGLELFGGEVALAGGVGRSDQGRTGLYVSVYLARAF